MRKSLPDCQIWDSCERRVEGSLSHLAFSPTPYSYRFFTPHFIFSCHLITRLSARRWRVNRSADRPSAINSTIRSLFDASRLLCSNNNIINLNNWWKYKIVLIYIINLFTNGTSPIIVFRYDSFRDSTYTRIMIFNFSNKRKTWLNVNYKNNLYGTHLNITLKRNVKYAEVTKDSNRKV